MKPHSRLGLFSSLLCLSLLAFKAKPHPRRDTIDRQLLVAFKDEKEAAKRAEIFKKHDLKELQKVGTSPLYLVETKAGVDIKKLQKTIGAEPGVRYAEPNMRMKIFKSLSN